MQMRQKATVFYVISFLNSMSNGFIGPFFIVYLLFLNFSAAQVGLLLMLQRLAIALFEFPTGAFADTYGNKRSVLISFALMSLVALGWFMSTSWTILAIIAVISGIAYTFQSGAKESLLISSLDLSEQTEERKSIFSSVSMVSNAGFIIGSAVGIGLSLVSLRSLWFAVFVLNGLLLIIGALFFIEQKKTEDIILAHEAQKITETVLAGFRYLKLKKELLIPLIIVGIMSAAVSAYGLAFTIHFRNELHSPNYFFGILGILSSLVGIVAVYLEKFISQKRSSIIILYLYAGILGFTFVLFGLTTTLIAGLILYLIIEGSIHAWYPLFQSWFNGFLPDAIRSSLLSFASTIALAAAAIAEGAAGVYLTFAPSVMILTGCSLLSFMIIASLIIHRSRFGFAEK